MKFTDKKYLHLEDYENKKIYTINFDAFTIGGDDDISLVLTINSDNSMDLEFDNDTINMFNDPMFNDPVNIFPINEIRVMLRHLKNNLLEYPYPTDYYKLIFKEK